MIERIRKLLSVRLIIFISASFIIVLYTLIMISGISDIDHESGKTKDKGYYGYYIFYQLLDRLGYHTSRIGSLDDHESGGVLFYFNYSDMDLKKFTAVKKWVEKGNIIFLCGIYAESDPFYTNSIIGEKLEVSKIHPLVKTGIDSINYTVWKYFDNVTTGTPLLGDEKGSALISAKYINGTAYLLPDNFFFSNESLRDINVALLLNNLMKEYYGEKIFVYEPESNLPANPILPLFRGKLFFITIHLILMAVVFGFSQAIRFGNPEKSTISIRRTLQEHLNAVGFFYEKARAFHLAASYGVRYFNHQARQILGIKKKITDEELAHMLGAGYLHDLTEVEIREIIAVPVDISEKNLLKQQQKQKSIIERIKKTVKW